MIDYFFSKKYKMAIGVLASRIHICSHFRNILILQNSQDVFNLFHETEKMMSYNNFLTNVQNETSKSNFNINFKQNQIAFKLSNNIFNISNDIQLLNKNSGKFYGKYAEHKLSELKYNLSVILEESFTLAKKTGEIFVRDVKIGEYNVSVSNSFHQDFLITTRLMSDSKIPDGETHVFDKSYEKHLFIKTIYDAYFEKIKNDSKKIT